MAGMEEAERYAAFMMCCGTCSGCVTSRATSGVVTRQANNNAVYARVNVAPGDAVWRYAGGNRA